MLKQQPTDATGKLSASDRKLLMFTRRWSWRDGLLGDYGSSYSLNRAKFIVPMISYDSSHKFKGNIQELRHWMCRASLTVGMACGNGRCFSLQEYLGRILASSQAIVAMTSVPKKLT